MLVVAVAGCGRLGLSPPDGGDARGAGDGGDGGVDASTGVVGPRWMRAFGVGSRLSGHGGGGGEVAVVQTFAGTFTTDGVSLTGMGFSSTAFIRYDAVGAIERAVTLDASGFCEMKAAIVDGDDTILAGLTLGTTTVPAYGACSIATNRQDPIALRIAADGTQSVVVHWTASGANAQAWTAAPLSDGSLVMSGIYSDGLTIAGPLPTAMADPNAWVARSNPASPTVGAWAFGLSANVVVQGARVSVAEDGLCAIGAFAGPATLFGTAVPHVGGFDAWVTHISSSGAVDYVRGVGSPANESAYEGNSSILALPEGNCTLGIEAPGDVTYDGTMFPVSGGPGLLLELAANGALRKGARFPATPRLARIGNRSFVAFGVSAPYTVGDQVHMPDGTDVLIIERNIDAQTDRLVGVVGGAGTQQALELFEVAPDALGIAVRNTGKLVFGAASLDSGASDIRAVGVLGI